MKKNIVLVCLVFLLPAFSCNSGSEKKSGQAIEIQKPERDFYNFNIRNNLDQTGELLLSTIANEIQYIPLETTPECFLSDCKEVKIFNNKIYVRDKNALYMFNMDGSFNQQIGNIGNGPGEYGQVFWFSSIDLTNEIVLFSYPTGRINVHDAESGTYKRSFNTDFNPNGVVEFPHGKITFFTWKADRSENPAPGSEVYICNPDGAIIDSIPDERLPRTGNMASRNLYYLFNGLPRYMDSYQDTLYSLTEEVIKKSYVNFGFKNKVNGNDLELKRLLGEIQYPDFLSIDEVIETYRSFFLEVDAGIGLYVESETYRFFYDKTSGQILNCTSVINDLDNGVPFWPRGVYKDSILIDFYPSIEFLEYFETNSDTIGRSETLNELIGKLEENDNPIVALTRQY